MRNQRIWPFKSPIYGAFRGEFGDIRVFFSLCIIIVTRLCASATRLLATEGGCSREGLHQCHESGFPQPFAGREGGQDWGQGQWKIFYSSAGLEDAQATVFKNRWILYGEAGRISINLHISGTERHALQACAHFCWVHIGCQSLPPSKHVTTLLPRLTIKAFFADLKRSNLGFTEGKYLWLCAQGLSVLAHRMRVCV